MQQPARNVRHLVVVAMAAGGVCLLLPQTPRAQARPSVEVLNSLAISRTQGAPRAWTVKEIQDAIPRDMPTRHAAAANAAPAGPPDQATGPGGFVRGGVAKAERMAGPPVQRAILPSAKRKTPPAPYEYPPPYTSYETFPDTGAQYRRYPGSTVGVLLFRIPGRSGLYRCSAASIGNYAIWTAGHCVVTPPGLVHTDFLFLPASRNGRPQPAYGQFTGAYAIYPDAWAVSGDLRYDWGAVILNPNSVDGDIQKVGDRVGWLGFAWNLPYLAADAHWTIVGYPWEPPFTGEVQQICQSSFAYHDTVTFDSGPYPLGVGCDQTGGASGAPWIRRYSGNPGEGNFLNGNLSYRLTVGGSVRVHEAYSPYFDDAARQTYECAVNSSPSAFRCVGPPEP